MEQEPELWRPVDGFGGMYEVSSLGRVMSHFSSGSDKRQFRGRGRLLRQETIKKGHKRVRLYRADRSSEHRAVHHLVLEAFVGPCPPAQECRHLDGDPGKNWLTNLAWGTRLENRADRIMHGRNNSGVAHHAAILTEDQVREIRATAKYYGYATDLARKFGVARSTVVCIRRGRSWAGVG